jgi:uncharacterized membrane protein YjjP (DUF1212 family)
MNRARQDHHVTLTIDACLLAGKIMLQSGAETYRVEDTMTRMAAACGIPAQSFVMPTGIIFSTDDAKWSKLNRISDRSTDLHKVIQVNQISRQLSHGLITIEEAYRQLCQVHEANAHYPILLRVLLSALTSGCFLLMFGGAWSDVLPACIAGGAGYALVSLVHQWVILKFFAELTASFAVGVLASLLAMAGLVHSFNLVVVSAVMPLVPGILITNAVRDLMTGHLVSGISKGVEASLTAFAIGTGIAVAIQLL